MKASDLPLVTLDLRHAGELLAHPCICGRPRCTLGDHLWRSTRDMAPGIRAQTTDPRVSGGTGSPVNSEPPEVDPTGALHREFVGKLVAAHAAARDLAGFMERYRPERSVPLADTASSEGQWCPNHLRYAGLCEPVTLGRDGLCRWCWEIRSVHKVLPDRQLMIARHERGRLTPQMTEDFLNRLKGARKAKRGR